MIKFISPALDALLILILVFYICIYFTSKGEVCERDLKLRALAAAIIEVDGGNGSIYELLEARADSEKGLREAVRRVLDSKRPVHNHQNSIRRR